jgi:hypothetical protein
MTVERWQTASWFAQKAKATATHRTLDHMKTLILQPLDLQQVEVTPEIWSLQQARTTMRTRNLCPQRHPAFNDLPNEGIKSYLLGMRTLKFQGSGLCKSLTARDAAILSGTLALALGSDVQTAKTGQVIAHLKLVKLSLVSYMWKIDQILISCNILPYPSSSFCDIHFL